ncbi:hypothetical protein N6L24_14170 [Cognatishimia sp. SS12]|uniref:hypothetical protein n=1 Tax=Cognatishimia sp. SS12 TaxID=2979465 RepID=UPI00232D6867|nr:hypothetical protein [Cognatishimia sp. SS12]MDC0739430.1 hypothetical protein [Cognatishimia sp. SS12]
MTEPPAKKQNDPNAAQDGPDAYEDGILPPPIYDAPVTPEEDLWFLPGPIEEFEPGASPLLYDRRDTQKGLQKWHLAEAAHYRALVRAAEALARYAERLKTLPSDLVERVALQSVSAILRSEGVWQAPEHIALFRALRIGSQEETRDLERASWAVRRLVAGRRDDPFDDGLHRFLGRKALEDPSDLPGEGQAAGPELAALGATWQRLLQGAGELHPLTRGACGLFLWRRLSVTSIDMALEPMVAMSLMAAGSQAPFAPMPDSLPQLHARAQDPEISLGLYYQTVEQGALAALLELDRLQTWREKARAETADLQGRTPARMIDAALRFPVFSAELAARMAGCSLMSARRNLNLFQARGLMREVTGQQRYRFWAAQL